MVRTQFGSNVVIGAGANVDATARLGVRSGRLKLRSPLRIGRNAVIRSGAVLYEGTTVGDGCETGHNVVVREENTIGRDFRLWNSATVDYGCVIGHRVKIHCNCYVAQFTVLEDDVFMAPGATIANDLYPGLAESAIRMRGPHLGRGVQVGVNATILPYVRVGAGSLIGAGTVVHRDLPAGVVAVGNPMRVIGRVDAKKKAWLKRLAGVGR